MTAYAAHLPTTPGYKLQRRNEFENMCEQIQYMTANKERVERLNIEPEYEDYESSDEEESHNTQLIRDQLLICLQICEKICDQEIFGFS